MSLIFEKIKEIARTLLPVMILVLILSITLIDVELNVIIRFIVCSLLLLIGLSIFLWGLDLAMDPIGEKMSWEVATSKSAFKIVGLSFLLGFLVTVAEPDLLILGSQVEEASGGGVSATIIVYLVSVGVGVMIMLGVFRLLRGKPLNTFMAVTYGLIFLLAIFVSEEFLAISFDASGATTGAFTTPFVLALSLGLSKAKGGKSSEENSFGLVGVMSAGPILAVMSMSIILGQKNIEGDIGEYAVADGILEPIIDVAPAIFIDSLVAILPITVLFFIYNLTKFKSSKDELSVIVKGLIFILLGLTLFLTAVNSGFMDMGRIMGMGLATIRPWVLIGVGFLLGLIVVLVEPAVHVLGEQIEEVTSGHIPLALIRLTLSIGVAMAIALSMVRIVVPEVKLWYFLLPGFVIAILLSFKSDPIFVGIAYDAGGVASGPLTATFVLAFAQGAASIIDTANVLVDGFGVVAMVAMAPVFSIMILGTVFKRKRIVEYPALEKKAIITSHLSEQDGMPHDCVIAIVNKNFAEKVVDVARQAGAMGATIVRGRGVDGNQKVLLPIINIELQPEKEIVWLITEARFSSSIADSLLANSQLHRDGQVAIFINPTVNM